MYGNQFRQDLINNINKAADNEEQTPSTPCKKYENQLTIDASEKQSKTSGGIRLWGLHPAIWVGGVIVLSALAIWLVPKIFKGKQVETPAV